MDPVRQNPIWLTCKPLHRMCNNRMLHITTIKSSLLVFPLTPDQHHWLEVATEDEGWCSFTSCSRSRARTYLPKAVLLTLYRHHWLNHVVLYLPGLPWIWIYPWIYPCVDIRLRLYCGYIHGYCTMHSAEMYARQRSFSASSWPIAARQ